MLHQKSLELLNEVEEIIGEYDFALTLRQIYYQLVAKQIIPNLQKHYARLSRLCVIARDSGILSEDAFVDRLREVDKPGSWRDLGDFMRTVRVAYKKDRWFNQDLYLEIWTEKDALRGVIAPVTHAYDVSLLIVRGQVSRTAIHESYERFAAKMDERKECYLYYFGDFDPSGLSIFSSLTARLKTHGNYGEEINFHRVALTPEQISDYELPQDPAKKSDPNYKRFVDEYGDNVVELDSLPPDALKKLVTERIESHIDFSELKEIEETEGKEMAVLQKFINRFNERS